jgi:hypothetical protein
MNNTDFNKYLGHLISAEGRKDYYSCLQDEREQLTALYIAQNPNEREEYLMQSRDYDVVIRLLNKYMITGDADVKEIMVDKMKTIAVDYFYIQIATLFNEELDTHFIEEMHDNNMVATRHKDNGEVEWVKR